MKQIQGYLVIIPNSPDGRGMLYFSLEQAKQEKKRIEQMIDNWDKPDYFNKEYWKEKPITPKIYSLIAHEEIKE